VSQLVFKVDDVAPFTFESTKHQWESRMLLDGDNVGSKRIVMNHFALRPGIRLSQSVHPEGFDELMYIVSGRGMLYLYAHDEPFPLEPGTVAFVPGGTIHSMESFEGGDLVMITTMPGPLAEGANPVYDARVKEWGTSFRLAGTAV
jgi:mannose-6-phosphate isomerase-like protein (cupin superfamily)